MHFSTILPITLSILASAVANPMALPKQRHHGAAAAAGNAASVNVTDGCAPAGNTTATNTTAVSAHIKANVTAQIVKWQSDIESVNAFIDTVSSITDLETISALAATAFVAAQDEGASNTILQQDVTLDASGQQAAAALIGQFGIIGPAINDTIFNPGNKQKNLDAINGARCPPPQGADAISQEGDVQAAAAKAVGITISPPQTPAACTTAASPTK